ncbi:hypothetical protein F183_A32070 [Bryobacterales bacterium F-183]|nr:hypothetical protein F183_A32070 [Bryobacterales bacterium F-183]
MNSKPFLRVLVAFAAIAGSAGAAGTLGRVVPIGGQGADLALDEARGVLYVANYTANRIEVMSLANETVQTSMNVASQPSSLALSPDGRYLVVAHYGNFSAPASAGNALTVIELESGSRQTFALGTPPLGVAFGLDGRALVVTSQEFIVFDPVSGTTQVIATLTDLAAKSLPQPAASFPTNIVAASVAASGDGLWIWGFGDRLMFRYDVVNRALSAGLYTASPPLGPRAVSVSRDGRMAAMGWALQDVNFFDIAEYPNPTGTLNVGSLLIDSARGLVYGQVATRDANGVNGTAVSTDPILHVGDWDNLTTREQIRLSENLAGKSVLSADGSMMYSISDSGIMVLPIGILERFPRVTALEEDMVFRGNYCVRTLPSQQLTIVDPGGGNTPFTLSVEGSGLRLSQTSGVTPATIQVSVDGSALQNTTGTTVAKIIINSDAAVNIPNPVRVLINNKEPDQRGTFVNVPGTLKDLVADPSRDRFYVLRQDRNQVLVYDGANSTRLATLRTCTQPMSMAVTFDRQHLLVGCDRSHYVSVFDLETLEPSQPIRMAKGDYVQSIATSNRGILASTRSSSGGSNQVHRIDMVTRTSTILPSLGIFENKVDVKTALSATPNGSAILFASSDGNVMLYDANVDTFTVSRKDFTSLSGAYAASSFNQYVVGNFLLNRSLVRVSQFDATSGTSSGFAFVDNEGFRTVAASASSPGIIQRMTASGSGIRATRMAEAPLLSSASTGTFTRTIAPLYSRSAIVNLTTSGFTVLPWQYDAAVAPPQIRRVVNAADQTGSVAPGGLVTIGGTNLSPVNLASVEKPLPTALGESCLTVNGLPLPVIFVSPNVINAQLPFQATGNVALILRTPGGVSDTYNLTIQPQAPSVFRTAVQDVGEVPTVIRAANRIVVTDSNPVHRNDTLTVFLTGLGQTNPPVESGMPAPSDPVAVPLVAPTVSLGGVALPVQSAAMVPGEIGQYQITVTVPRNVPTGLSVPLQIRQGNGSTTLNLRVVE